MFLEISALATRFRQLRLNARRHYRRTVRRGNGFIHEMAHGTVYRTLGDAQERGTDRLWSALEELPQEAQETIAAGFENVSRRLVRPGFSKFRSMVSSNPVAGLRGASTVSNLNVGSLRSNGIGY
jgi:hypothetical protein